MKKFMALLTSGVLMLSTLGFATSAYADDDIQVEFNGALIAMEQSPVIEDGRVLVPFRFFAETFDANIDWNADSKTVTCVKDGTTIVMSAGSRVMKLNGQDIAVDVPVEIINNRVMVPIRVIATGFGANVNWDANSRTATISTGDVHADRINTAGSVTFTYAETASKIDTIDASAKYPVFTGSFGSAVNAAIAAKAQKDVDDYVNEVKDNPSHEGDKLDSSYEVKCNSDGFVSILNTNYSMVTGAAHGYTSMAAKTYSAETGQELDLTSAQLKQGIAQFKTMITESPEEYFEDALDNLTADNIGWYIDENEHTILFINTEIIGPHARGIVTTTVEDNGAVNNNIDTKIDISKLSTDKLFVKGSNISATANYPIISGDYAAINTAIKNFAQYEADEAIKEYQQGANEDREHSYSVNVNLSVPYADDSKICLLSVTNVDAGGVHSMQSYASVFYNVDDGTLADAGSNEDLKEQGAKLMNQMIEEDKTGKFFKPANVTADDVGYYFNQKGVVYFVQDSIIAPHSEGVITIEEEAQG